MKTILIVIGTRPNFIKAYPLIEAFKKKTDVDINIINTGQHYDKEMAKVFLDEFNIDCCKTLKPNQTWCDIIFDFNWYFMNGGQDLVIVFGDTDSSMACALAASKHNIPIAHIEAGERSYNLQMQEEKNRLIIDSLSNYLFCSSEGAELNLVESCDEELYSDKEIHHVGNIHADAVKMILDKTKYVPDDPYGKYAVLTLHRAENVDDKERLEKILTTINDIAKEYKNAFDIIFPIHPRTEKRLEEFDIPFSAHSNLKKVSPFNYNSFIRIVKNALFVMTDSGGLQTETTMLDVPCLTFRNETEWGITISDGTNFLVKDEYMNIKTIKPMIDNILGGRWKNANDIKYWDGKTSERIVDILMKR